MAKLSPQELEIAQLIVEALNLGNVQAQDIDAEDVLFRQGLGLDSIDALELALVISRKYGFRLRSDEPNNHKIFSSLRALSRHIDQNRTN